MNTSKILVTEKNLQAVINQIRNHEERSFDSETYGTLFTDKAFSFQVSTEEAAYYFNLHDYGDGTCTLSREVFKETTPLWEEVGALWYAHNSKFDLHRLYQEGIKVGGKVHCTQMCERFIYNQHMLYSLDACLRRRGRAKDDAVKNYVKKHKLYHKVFDPNKNREVRAPMYWKVPFPIMFEYGCSDTDETLFLGKDQRKELVGQEFYENSLYLEKVCHMMEEEGINIDIKYAKGGLAYELQKAKEHETILGELSGRPYRNGPKWLKEVLDAHGIQYPINPKTNNPIFDKHVLGKMQNPIAQHILKYRRHEKYASTYYSAYVNQPVVHATIKTAGTDTCRFSYADPNLQNVPKEEELDESIPYQVRGCIVAPEDFALVMIDYDQQEFRLLLDYAGEMELIRRINEEGVDVHQATADLIGVTRKQAKTINFGLLYGMGVELLAAQLKCSTHEAKSIRAQYFARLPRVKALIADIMRVAEQRKHIKSWVGRKMHFPNKEFAYAAPNHLIQGGCGDIMRKAMVDIDQQVMCNVDKSKMLLQVHDELLFKIHKTEVDIIPAIVSIMENTYRPFNGMKLTCGIDHSFKSWGKRDAIKGIPVF